MPHLLHHGLLAAALAALPVIAQANCYTLFDAKNELVRQTSLPLVDMSRPIQRQVETQFPGHFLVVHSMPDCLEIRKQRAGATAAAPVGAATGTADEIPMFKTAKRIGADNASGGLPVKLSSRPVATGIADRGRSFSSTSYSAPTLAGNSTSAAYKR